MCENACCISNVFGMRFVHFTDHVHWMSLRCACVCALSERSVCIGVLCSLNFRVDVYRRFGKRHITQEKRLTYRNDIPLALFYQPAYMYFIYVILYTAFTSELNGR